MKSLVMFTTLLLLMGVSTNAQIKVSTPRLYQPSSISVIYHNYNLRGDEDAVAPGAIFHTSAVELNAELKVIPQLHFLLGATIIERDNPPYFVQSGRLGTAKFSLGFKISF